MKRIASGHLIKFANQRIEVTQAADYEVDVSIKVGGFEAMPEPVRTTKKIKKMPKCGSEGDLPDKDSSELIETSDSNLLKHLYSFQRTPVATSATIAGSQLTVTSSSFSQATCQTAFEVKGIQ